MGTSLTNVPQAPVVRCEQMCAYVGEQTFRSPADRIKYPGQWHQSGKKFQLAALATSPSRKTKTRQGYVQHTAVPGNKCFGPRHIHEPRKV